LREVVNEKQERIGLSDGTGEIHVLDHRDRTIETFSVPNGALLLVENEAPVSWNTMLARWDVHSTPLLADRNGRARLVDMVEGQTFRKDRDDRTAEERWVIMDHRGELHPRIDLEDDAGKIVASVFVPEKSIIDVREGVTVSPGTTLARVPREPWGTRDLVGGLPRLSELFEARTPRDPAPMARVDGIVRWGDQKRGKRIIYIDRVDNEGRLTGEPVEHVLPVGKHRQVYTGDRVKAGERLASGDLVPRDILRVVGPEALQMYLLQEAEVIFCSQRVAIADTHIEVP
jgi:DNA-directed RNA polymerase subunit beta'